MNILPYKLSTTKDLLTSRAGLLTVAQLMESLHLPARINKHFPAPKSNRGFMPATFIQSLILMQHEGSFHLDDVRHIKDDVALRAEIAKQAEGEVKKAGISAGTAAIIREALMGKSNG